MNNFFIVRHGSFSHMLAEEIAIGMRVRYPRTGTTGNILRIEERKGATFAELDANGLLYRIDHLIPASGTAKKITPIRDDAQQRIAQEREFAAGSGLQEALKNIDQSCEGGG